MKHQTSKPARPQGKSPGVSPKHVRRSERYTKLQEQIGRRVRRELMHSQRMYFVNQTD